MLTGVPGSGKTTVLVELLDQLEREGVSCAGIDLDWLCWVGPGDDAFVRQVLSDNLRDVAARYVQLGVRRLLLARALTNEADLAAIRSALDIPLHVVGLSVDVATVQQRLGADTCAARADDLALAKRLLDGDVLTDLELSWVDATASASEVADAVRAFVGW